MDQDQAEVTRSVVLEAAPDAVWDLLADDESRRLWLDDDDAVTRAWRIDGTEVGRSLTWTWWHPDDPQSASQVEVVLDEQPDGGTRVVVTERLTASASAATARASVWDGRLLGLELLLVAAGAFVA
jgi:uncharacterized protein YndB with AHSA1/START domain